MAIVVPIRKKNKKNVHFRKEKKISNWSQLKLLHKINNKVKLKHTVFIAGFHRRVFFAFACNFYFLYFLCSSFYLQALGYVTTVTTIKTRKGVLSGKVSTGRWGPNRVLFRLPRFTNDHFFFNLRIGLNIGCIFAKCLILMNFFLYL